jgi:uncharacterized lipoprotein YbaY
MSKQRFLAALFAASAVLSLAACASFTDRTAPAGSPADISDPGRENSTPSTVEGRTYGSRDTAFPMGSRDTSTD